jgi:quinol monooxygenase YgiN
MVHTFASFHVVPNKVGEFEAVHRRMLELLCARPGCISVKVHRSLSDPLEYAVYGTWESKDAWVKAHQTTEQFRELFTSLPIEGHTVSRASFFEPAYEFVGAA